MKSPTRLEPGSLTGLRPPWALVGIHLWTGEGAARPGAVSFGSDGRVLACGSAADVVAGLPRGADIIEGGDAFVCPGFVDPHVHVRAAASAALATDLSAARRPADVISAVRRDCSGKAGWRTFSGLERGSPLEGGAPDRRELDRASRGARVRIRAGNGHGWLFNSDGLGALGIDVDATTQAVPAGVAVERGADRTPTGFVVDHAGWVGSRLGRLTDAATLAQSVRTWSRRLAQAGIVAVCDATATNGPEEVESLLGWVAEGELTQELVFLTDPGAQADERSAGLKFANAHDPRLAGAIARCPEGQFVAVHCVDPGETAAALRAAATASPGRLRLEHASFVPPDWLGAARRAGASVVTHPSFVEAYGERYLSDPALEPHDWLYRLASWTNAGVPLAFASDAPFGPVDPLAALRAAATRRTAAGRVLGPREALAGDLALRGVTASAADCSGLARLGYGRLTAGGPGAAVVLTGDPRQPRTLEAVALVATVIGGEVDA